MSSTLAPASGDARAFADELERYRIARGLTPAEMSRQIGASTSQVSRWRRGHGISLEHLQKVATWMDRPLAELMVLAGYPAPLAVRQKDPSDPRFQALRSVWDRLDESRRQIIAEIALAGAACVALLALCKRALGTCRIHPRVGSFFPCRGGALVAAGG